MTEHPTGPIPYLVARDAAKLIEFYKAAFDAVEGERHYDDSGKKIMHTDVKIHGGTIFLCDDFPEYTNGESRAPAAGSTGGAITLHLGVPDIDAAVRKAEAAGAIITMPPTDMFWGDRYGKFLDPSGHEWSMSTPIKK